MEPFMQQVVTYPTVPIRTNRAVINRADDYSIFYTTGYGDRTCLSNSIPAIRMPYNG